MQERYVVLHESRKLNEHEYNYVAYDLELAIITHALKMWRHYLLDKRFILMSDHNGLRYLFDQPKMDVRQAIWLDTLSGFQLEIRYIKDKENRVAYALSRKVQVNHISVVSSYGIDLQEWNLQAG